MFQLVTSAGLIILLCLVAVWVKTPKSQRHFSLKMLLWSAFAVMCVSPHLQFFSAVIGGLALCALVVLFFIDYAQKNLQKNRFRNIAILSFAVALCIGGTLGQVHADRLQRVQERIAQKKLAKKRAKIKEKLSSATSAFMAAYRLAAYNLDDAGVKINNGWNDARFNDDFDVDVDVPKIISKQSSTVSSASSSIDVMESGVETIKKYGDKATISKYQKYYNHAHHFYVVVSDPYGNFDQFHDRLDEAESPVKDDIGE